MVVTVVALLLSMVTVSPIIFQRLAELEDGEVDLRLTSVADPPSLLNYTQFTLTLDAAAALADADADVIKGAGTGTKHTYHSTTFQTEPMAKAATI